MDNTTSNSSQPPKLYYLTSVAARGGLTPRQFARGCRTGRIPCRLVEVGDKLTMVVAADALAWFASFEPRPNQSLF